MRDWLLIADCPPEIAADYLAENGWTLAEVLEWFAGKFCGSNHLDYGGWALWPDALCEQCWAEPPAEYGRDVLACFLRQGGATHPRQVEWADQFHVLSEMGLHLKRCILRLFSGPVEDGGVRIKRVLSSSRDYTVGEEITPEELLPRERFHVRSGTRIQVNNGPILNAKDWQPDIHEPDSLDFSEMPPFEPFEFEYQGDWDATDFTP
jgi:hypothetical protein